MIADRTWHDAHDDKHNTDPLKLPAVPGIQGLAAYGMQCDVREALLSQCVLQAACRLQLMFNPLAGPRAC
jgi:hypothetical protein